MEAVEEKQDPELITTSLPYLFHPASAVSAFTFMDIDGSD